MSITAKRKFGRGTNVFSRIMIVKRSSKKDGNTIVPSGSINVDSIKLNKYIGRKVFVSIIVKQRDGKLK